MTADALRANRRQNIDALLVLYCGILLGLLGVRGLIAPEPFVLTRGGVPALVYVVAGSLFVYDGTKRLESDGSYGHRPSLPFGLETYAILAAALVLTVVFVYSIL